MDFDEWIYKVCEHISQKTRKDIDDIFQSVNLTSAKLLFIDNISPEEVEANEILHY